MSAYWGMLLTRTPLLKRLKTIKAISASSAQSVVFAKNFLDRRKLGLEEVREIAIIGE